MQFIIQTFMFFAFISFVTTVVAVCCPSVEGRPPLPPFPQRFCHDNKPATPCCGRGSCNIFCCDCDRGCRHPLKVTAEHDDLHFAVADTNGDGKLTFDEWSIYAASPSSPYNNWYMSAQEDDIVAFFYQHAGVKGYITEKDATGTPKKLGKLLSQKYIGAVKAFY